MKERATARRSRKRMNFADEKRERFLSPRGREAERGGLRSYRMEIYPLSLALSLALSHKGRGYCFCSLSL